jgi:hypothetical protein
MTKEILGRVDAALAALKQIADLIGAAKMIPLRFTLEQAISAGEDWGANCGPGALAAITGKTLDEIRPHMGDFEAKRYTNPTLMFQALKSLGVAWRCGRRCEKDGRVSIKSDQATDWTPDGLAWPKYGLARIQWEGPWTAPGVRISKRYRHTHWVGSLFDGVEHWIFDINCMCAGGWVPFAEWSGQVVPWLLGECEPKADGRWHITHAISVEAPISLTGPTSPSLAEAITLRDQQKKGLILDE